MEIIPNISVIAMMLMLYDTDIHLHIIFELSFGYKCLYVYLLNSRSILIT